MLPVIRGKDLVAFLETLGFTVILYTDNGFTR